VSFVNELQYNATVGYGTVSDSGAADFDAYVAGSGADDEYVS